MLTPLINMAGIFGNSNNKCLHQSNPQKLPTSPPKLTQIDQKPTGGGDFNGHPCRGWWVAGTAACGGSWLWKG